LLRLLLRKWLPMSGFIDHANSRIWFTEHHVVV
jgi:hypothetical protein